MAKSTQPAPAAETPPLDEQPVEQATAAPGCWRYTDTVARVYTHVPVTVEFGDVIAHDGPPAEDGRWEEHPGPATRGPDNIPQPAPADAAEPATVEE